MGKSKLIAATETFRRAVSGNLYGLVEGNLVKAAMTAGMDPGWAKQWAKNNRRDIQKLADSIRAQVG